PNKAGSNGVHGAPLGEEETKLFKQSISWEYDPFKIPTEVYEDFKSGLVSRGEKAYKSWSELFESYAKEYPVEFKELEAVLSRIDINSLTEESFDFKDAGEEQATRNSSQDALNSIAKVLPTFFGGS
ncbi:transketolase, partial [Streptococcus danieliae]|nr:transketolase [Streptococcus danieliae]